MSSPITAADLGQQLIQQLIAAGLQAATRLDARVSIAVVDTGGHLAGFLRMEGVHTATVDVAQAKARSAAAFRRSTRIFATQLAEGNLSMLAVPGCVPLAGGIPLTRAQRLVGAVGVSGASPDTDEAIAEAVYAQLHESLTHENVGGDMPYLIIAEDAPGMAETRARNRPAHLDYIRANLGRLLAAGARLNDDGLVASGSMYILDTDSRDDAEAFIRADPYMREGVFASHTITRWRKGVLDRQSFLA